MTERAEAPAETVAALRSVCLALPETYEEEAWVGTRWRIRTKTFGHVLAIDAGWPPAYAWAAGSPGPIVVLTFSSSGTELDVLGHAGPPFFKPVWRRDVVGIVLAADVDWDDVSELITESYCALAPKRLVVLVHPPTA